MKDKKRRDFIATTGKLLAGTAAVAAWSTSQAADHSEHHSSSSDGLVVAAAVDKTCASCEYWGGMRRISEDGTQISTQSMGWCNNPPSPNYQKLTQADHQMTEAGVWKKWAAL